MKLSCSRLQVLQLTDIYTRSSNNENVPKKDKINKIDNEDKVKVELDRDIANQLIQLKKVGDSYSDIIRRLLDEKKE